MKVMKNLPLVLSLLGLFHCLAFSTEVGTTGMGFLKIRTSARPLGMGNAFVAVADDISAMAWNVAGLATLEQQELLFTHFNYIDGIGYSNLLYCIPGKRGTIGFGFAIQSFTIDEIDAQYNYRGEMAIRNAVFSLAYSLKLGDSFAYGCGIDLFSSTIGNYSLTSYGLNFGSLYFAPYDIIVGLSVQNIGPEFAYESKTFVGEKQSLPSTYIIGVTKKLTFYGDTLLVTSDIVKDYAMRLNVGIEYKLLNLLTLRVGRRIGYDTGSFAFGMGINYKLEALDYFQFDYAFFPMSELGSTHCYSLISKF